MSKFVSMIKVRMKNMGVDNKASYLNSKLIKSRLKNIFVDGALYLPLKISENMQSNNLEERDEAVERFQFHRTGFSFFIWKKTKLIFNIDSNVSSAVCDTNILDIKFDLDKLPLKVISIDLSNDKNNTTGMLGFICHFINLNNTHYFDSVEDDSLTLLQDEDTTVLNITTLSDDDGKFEYISIPLGKDGGLHKAITNTNGRIKTVINLIYFCLTEYLEKHVEYDNFKQHVNKVTDERVYPNLPDRPKPMHLDLGSRLSKALVKHNERLREHKRSTGKEPHVRCAHWHNYWCGSGDNRRQELRWVKSTIVGLSKIKVE